MPNEPTDSPTGGDMLAEVMDLTGGLVIVSMPLFILSLPGILAFVVAPAVLLLAVLAVPAAVLGALAAPPYLLYRALRGPARRSRPAATRQR
jgi:hypothetical protein